MAKRAALIWIVTVVLLVGLILGLFVRNRYVLDSRKLDADIKAQLPTGSSKLEVIQFIQARKPLFWDDFGTHIKARMTGRAENLIYRKDVVLDFQFDSSLRLVSCTKNVSLTFF